MPQYRVLQTSFIGNRLVQEGDVIDFDGEPSDNLEPMDKAAKKAAAAANSPEAQAEALARLSAAANAGNPDVPALTEADKQDAARMSEAAQTGALEAPAAEGAQTQGADGAGANTQGTDAQGAAGADLV